jgi:hypothetical protein
MKGTVDRFTCDPLLELIIHTVLIHFSPLICMGLLKMLACRYALIASIILKLITCVVNNPATYPFYHGPPQYSRATPLKLGNHRRQAHQSLMKHTNQGCAAIW